jgi:hypothetical protein
MNKRGVILSVLILFIFVSISFVSATNTESFKFEKASNKLNLGESLRDFGFSLDNNDLPNFLKDGLVNEYRYEQKITMGQDLVFQNFSDSDHNDGEYTIGMKISANKLVFNYTLDFLIDPRLSLLENKEIYFLGREYDVVDVKHKSLDDFDQLTLEDSEGTILVLKSGNDINFSGSHITNLEVLLDTDSSKLDRIIVSWKTEEDSFVSVGTDFSLPALNTLKFRFEGLSFYDDPYDEEYDEYYGNMYLDAFYENIDDNQQNDNECEESVDCEINCEQPEDPLCFSVPYCDGDKKCSCAQGCSTDSESDNEENEFYCEIDNDCILKDTSYCCVDVMESYKSCYHIDEEPPILIDCVGENFCPMILESNNCKCENNICVDSNYEDEDDEPQSCVGKCSLGDSCVDIGYRSSNFFCDTTEQFSEQKDKEQSCENNFECRSNLCIENECLSGSIWAKFLRWIRNIFG